jgi:DNA-binding MarR family transcriptional regulator
VKINRRTHEEQIEQIPDVDTEAAARRRTRPVFTDEEKAAITARNEAVRKKTLEQQEIRETIERAFKTKGSVPLNERIIFSRNNDPLWEGVRLYNALNQGTPITTDLKNKAYATIEQELLDKYERLPKKDIPPELTDIYNDITDLKNAAGVKGFLSIPYSVTTYFNKLLKLKSGEILVLCQIAALCNTKGFCYMSDTTIADKVGITERNIMKITNRLEAKGIIAKENALSGSKWRRVWFINEKYKQLFITGIRSHL